MLQDGDGLVDHGVGQSHKTLSNDGGILFVFQLFEGLIDLVDEFFKSLKETSKAAAKGAWDGAYGYIIGGIIATIIFALIRACH
jgi:hypothetical protein